VEKQLRPALKHYTSIRLGRSKKIKIKESHNLYQGQDINLGPPKYKSGNVNHYSLIWSLVYVLFFQRKDIIERKYSNDNINQPTQTFRTTRMCLFIIFSMFIPNYRFC
jgi:hypothetical protein